MAVDTVDVTLQVSGLSETFLAVVAHKRSLSRVCAHVLLESGRVAEGLIAKLTLMRLLLGVSFHVNDQVGSGAELFV